MRMLLRITFNDKDYNFKVLSNQAINKETTEISIELQGQVINLSKALSGWVSKDLSKEDIPSGLIQAIGRAIELRYRM